MLDFIILLVGVALSLIIIHLKGGVQRNLIIIIIALELLLLAAALMFMYSGFLFDDAIGLLYGLIILVLAGCESALALGIVVKYYVYNKNILIK
jgi:NADH:ubiquinone oxidoreductase subunit K